MKRNIIILLTMMLGACGPDPSFEYLEQYRVEFLTSQGGRYQAGELVSGPVKFSVTDYNNDSPDDSFRVDFEVIKGGGFLSVNTAYTNNLEIAATQWRLGSSSFEQVLRASVYTSEGKYLTSTDLKAFGFREGEWDEVIGSPDGNMTGMVADTVNDLTLMITNGSIYRQGSRHYYWEKLSHPVLDSPRTMEIDRNGVIYVSTWNGEVLKSTDHGFTWIRCTKPYPDHPYYIFMYVANDNWIWVYKFDYPTKFSKDGGLTWTEAGSNLSSYGYGDVFRLKDGTLLFHGSNCCSLSKSVDDGATWTRIETPGYSHKLYVNENDEIFITNQENGCTIHRSTDMGKTFQRLYSVWPQFGTTMDNVFNKYGSTYYIQIPGYGVLQSPDLIHYEPFYLNDNINNLFIDHKGVLVAKDWDSNTIWYYKIPDK